MNPHKPKLIGPCSTCGSYDPRVPNIVADHDTSRAGFDCPDLFHQKQSQWKIDLFKRFRSIK